MLPTDYLQGANGTNRKPALYLMVRVVKYVKDWEDLFVDTNKRDGLHHIHPYHSNAQPLNKELHGHSLPIEEGAYCYYPDSIQRELQIFPWADHTSGPWVVVIGLGTTTHYTAA
ncbi:MAG: hypothetical protein GY832_11820, partial [Chloroflexi bacterium]|nr:hypothetical protein [Chloroflexota bacterium]